MIGLDTNVLARYYIQVVRQALAHHAAGLDLADALHHASYRDCDSIASFDDHKFTFRIKRMGLLPTVMIPS